MRQLNLCLACVALGAKQLDVAFIEFRATIAPLNHMVADQAHGFAVKRMRRAATLTSPTAFCDQPSN
jgi:hypothetical protein